MYVQAPEHLPKIDTAVPTYYGRCRSCIVRQWGSSVGDRRCESSGPEWEDCRCHLWSAAHHKLLIIVKGLISDPPTLSSLILCILRPVSPLPHVIIRHIRGLFSRWFTTITLWFPPTLFCVLLCRFILLSSHFLCLWLCSPGYFLALYFRRCQSLLLKAFAAAHPSQRTFPPSCHTVLIC